MTVIELDRDVVTMVNTFTVEPANQERLVELIVEATESVMRHVDGFVSANIHASLDGTRVVNYAQWRSVEHFQAMHSNPRVHPHFADIRAIATPEMHLYRVSHVEEAPARS